MVILEQMEDKHNEQNEKGHDCDAFLRYSHRFNGMWIDRRIGGNTPKI
jgi:hypothetical protein